MASDSGPGEGKVRVTPERLAELIHSQSLEELKAAAASSYLSEDLALQLLVRRELHSAVLEALSRNGGVMKHRDVILAVVAHPKTPRHVSLPISRRLYTFELMKLALMPTLVGDLRVAIEENVISRLESVTSGERLALARSGPGAVAAALLSDPELRVVSAALNNPRMTEGLVIQALMRDNSPAHLTLSLCKHEKWSLRREIRMALLGSKHTPLAPALQFAESLPPAILEDILSDSDLDPQIKTYLASLARRRVQRALQKRAARGQSAG